MRIIPVEFQVFCSYPDYPAIMRILPLLSHLSLEKNGENRKKEGEMPI
jgi:hypothetical protein